MVRTSDQGSQYTGIALGNRCPEGGRDGPGLGAPLGISLLGPAGSDRSLVRLAERIAAVSG